MESRIKKIIIVIAVVIVVILLLMLKCNGKGKTKKIDVSKPAEAAAPAITEVVTESGKTETPVLTPVPEKKTAEKMTKKAPDTKGYDIQITEKDGEKIFKVTKNGKELVIKKSGEKSGFKMNVDGENKSIPKAFEDFTGDGKENFILQQFSEKDSCSNVYTMFSVDEDFEIVTEIKGLDSKIEFKDLDGDKIPELLGNDCTFLNWWASFGETVSPPVIMRYIDGHYELYGDLMRKDPPDTSEMQAYADKNKGSFISYVWAYMLDLIYTGNGDMAWEFFNMVHWDEDWEGEMMAKEDGVEKKTSDKADFLEAFKEQLSTSPYWEDIKTLNSWEMDEMMM